MDLSRARLSLRWIALLAAFLFVGASASCNDTAGGPDSTSGASDAAPDTGVAPDTDESEDNPGADAGDTGPRVDGPTWDTSVPPEGDGGLRPLKLKGVTPARGPVSGGTKFVLTGEGFTGETEVFFGSNKAQANLVDGKIVGQTPAAAGPGPVSVKVLDPKTGKAGLSKGFRYTLKLQIRSASPTKLPTAGGVEVTIKGQGFGPKSRVSFDGNTALQHTFVNSSTLRVKAPPNASGPADLRVTTPAATVVSRDAVEYVSPLEVDRVRPATGTTGGGDLVKVYGSGFRPGMSVTFGGAAATLQSVKSDGTRATVKTPAHSSGLVDVAVSTPSGNGALAEDAFYYRSNSTAFELAAVRPDHAEESGNVDVTLIGSGMGRSGLSVTFGGNSATVGSTGPGHAVVTVPPHAPGKVDVSISDGSGNSSTLTKGFEYVADLEISNVQPNRGGVGGGTSVTLDGKGFQGVSRVEFGGVAAQFSIASNTKITATAPKHAPGTVDVRVVRDPVEAVASDAFTYTEPLKVFGLSPVRGSRAGNTYVEIRGRGFIDSKMDVSFGSNPAKSIRVVDPQTLVVRTPRHAPGAVDVTVSRGSKSTQAPQQFTFFNPGSNEGGVWGGPIRGAVNVSVFSVAGKPIPNAFVMLSTNSQTSYKGQTDPNGQVTLSGPHVYGSQTITATASGYTSTTMQHVDSENVTIFLTPMGSGGSPPSPPPTATFKGKLTGLEKIASPNPNEYIMAIILPTKESPWERNPRVESGNILRSNGSYEITTRVGDLALVAIGGLLNTDTQTLTPIRMGVKRYISAAGGKTYTKDIDLNIPMNQTLRFKLQNPPHSKGGPDVNRVTPYLDFGFEGVFGQVRFTQQKSIKIYAQGNSSVVKNQHMPKLDGKLSDVTIRAVGGAYTKTMNGALGAPQSVATKEGIKKTNQLVSLPPLVGVPLIQSPPPGSKPTNNLISWRLNSSNRPDFFFVQILTGMGRPLWHGFVPGSDSSLRLPDFPSFSHLPKNKRPAPYPGGTFQLVVIAGRSKNAGYSNFTYSDLSFESFEAFAADTQEISF